MASNYDDVLDQLRGAGLLVDGLQTGRLVRCKVEGDREKRGWYSLHELTTAKGEVIICGSFGVWHGSSNNATKVELRKSEISTEQRESLRRRMLEDRRAADRLRAAEAARAAARATSAWSKYTVDGDSEYLKRKGVNPFGVRFTPSGAVVVPVGDAAGRVHGLQIIRTAAQARERRRPAKEFWPPGVAKKGHFHLIGAPGQVVLVAEGYATAASLHMATSLAVAVAFDAGNLAPVCAALRKRYRTIHILVCADDDAFTDGNPGVTAASAAAMEVGGAWIKPVFANEAARAAKHAANGAKLTDFNDLHVTDGLRAVGAQIEARLSELRWSTLAPTTSRGVANKGEGSAAIRPLESVSELLERFALIYGHGGVVFDRQEHCILSVSDMRDSCCRREVHRAWMESPERAIVRLREVGFDPSESDPEITCNLWSGWPTRPEPGCCDKLLELLWYMTEREPARKELYDWLLCWLAYPIQHPGAKLKTTVVIHGPQGTGKNLFFETIMAIYGPYGRVIDQAAIEDKFNDWASKKLFLIADEVVARSDLYHIKNKLKVFISGDDIRVNPKNIAAYDERNHVNLVFLSNEAQPVVLEEDDRRHAVIWTPEKLPPAFYASVVAEIRNGGRAALHDHLLKVDLGDFTPATLPPWTSAKQELVEMSLDSTSRFYYALEAREIPIERLAPALSQDVYDVYRAWCGRTGMRPAPMPRLVNALNRKHKVPTVRKRYIGPGGLVGPHGLLMLGSREPPDGASEPTWIGDCVAAFKAAASDYLNGGGR